LAFEPEQLQKVNSKIPELCFSFGHAMYSSYNNFQTVLKS
jgi:hypothetical protein